MRSVEESLSDTSAMLDSIRQVTRIANDMVQSNAEYIKDLRENQKQTDEAFERVASSVEQMDLISRQQMNYLKSVSSMHEEVTRSMDQMTGALNDFTLRVGEQSANATAGLQTAAAELRATGATLQEIHRECAASINSELKLTLDAYQDYVNQFTQRVDYLAGGIADSLSRLPAAVDEGSNLFLDQVDRLTETLVQAQRALNDTVERLNGENRPRR